MITLTVSVLPIVHVNGDEATVRVVLMRDGVLVDPDTVDIVVTDPDGAESVYQWPSEDVTHEGVGTFSATVLHTGAGKWRVFAETADPAMTSSSTWKVQPKHETLTVSVLDTDDAPLPGVSVLLLKTSGGVVAAGESDADGEVVLRVQPGTYDVTGFRKKTAFAPATVAVTDTGDAEPQTYTLRGVPQDIPSTTTVRRVRVFGKAFRSDGTPAGGVRVQATTQAFGNISPFMTPQTEIAGIAASSVFLSAERRETLTYADGYWEMDLVADALVLVEIAEIGYSKTFRVPNSPNILTFNLRDVFSSFEVSQR